MKLKSAPCTVSGTISLARANPSFVDEEFTMGGIFGGMKYVWLSNGPYLKILDVSTGEKVSCWKFGTSHPEFATRVSCVMDLPVADDTTVFKQIVVGLEIEVMGGMLCIFDIQGSRLLRAISISQKVMSLSIVDSGSSGCEGRYPLPGLLSSMSGIIAVGLFGGKVKLMDLCRLTCEELLNTWFNDDREPVRDESYPCQLIRISEDDDDDSDTLEKKRAEAAVTGKHLCLLLNDDAFHKDDFVLRNAEGHPRAVFKAHLVGVTSLVYIPRIASLAVGYSFGCFQIWNLMHLNLMYTSHFDQDLLPVVQMGFLEPSDDPRNFCYLWTVHSSTEDYPTNRPPGGVLYALTYDSKEWVDGYGYLYQDYQSCRLRFEYSLPVDDHHKDVCNVRCISFHTLSNAIHSQKNISEDGYDEVATENDLSLSVFVWEAYDSERRPVSTCMSLFDLNQWYKDHMPEIYTDDDDGMGYLVTFTLDGVREGLERSFSMMNAVLDMRVDPLELSQFRSFQPQEEHYRPSALSFASAVLLEDRIVTFHHPGLQRYLLLHMEKEGPACLLHPTQLYHHCQLSGLKPVVVDNNGNGEIHTMEQREFLLSVALENQMGSFLYRCAADWSVGSVSVLDCSLPMLLSWGFQRAGVLKEAADKLCVPLFDHSGVQLDKNESRLLENYSSQLRRLSSLFQGILNDYKLSNMLDGDFKHKSKMLDMVAVYFEVLPWFLKVGLLPEIPEDEAADVCPLRIPYPARKSAKFYQDRRNELKMLNEQRGTRASLFIDKVLENEPGRAELAELWKSDGGSGLYPPPSVQSLLAVYLMEGIDIETKHTVVIYVFLDLAYHLDEKKYSEAIENFMKFPFAFCLKSSVIKMTQVLWLLDQRRFEDALDMALDPLVLPKDLLPWHHRYIVHALLCQGEYSRALQYFIVRKLPVHDLEDIKLKLSLLVVNRQVTQAYTYLQQYQSDENNKELVEHFFKECARARELGTVMKLMLSPAEEELFMNFLQTSNIKQSDDMQVTFYLMRSRFIEAHTVNEKINSLTNRKSSSNAVRMGQRERNIRDLLVEGYTKTLPKVTRELAQYCSQQKRNFTNWRQVQRPTPMSVDVHYGSNKQVRYKSSLIHATLEKARETWMMSGVPTFNSGIKEKEKFDVTSVQNLPFLCCSVDGIRHDRDTTPITFPSLASRSGKRCLDADDESSPLKRCRLDNSSMKNFYQINSSFRKENKRTPMKNNSFLKSPLVTRRTPVRHAGDMGVSRNLEERQTPQSILKVRSVRYSESPDNRVSTSTPFHGPREGTPGKLSEDKSSSRQIRFSLPVHEEPLSCSTPEDEERLRSSNKIASSVSRRLPLRSPLTLSSKVIGNTTERSNKDVANVSQRANKVFFFGVDSSPAQPRNSPQSENQKENDSGESFYSAAGSSSPSQAENLSLEEEEKKEERKEKENGSPHQKYLDEIKQVKPRRHLPRLEGSPVSDSEKTPVVQKIVAREDKEIRGERESNSSGSESEVETNVPIRRSILTQLTDDEISFNEILTKSVIVPIPASSVGDDSEDSAMEEDVSFERLQGQDCLLNSSRESLPAESFEKKTITELAEGSLPGGTLSESRNGERSILNLTGAKPRRPLNRLSNLVDNSIASPGNISLLCGGRSSVPGDISFGHASFVHAVKKDLLLDVSSIELSDVSMGSSHENLDVDSRTHVNKDNDQDEHVVDVKEENVQEEHIVDVKEENDREEHIVNMSEKNIEEEHAVNKNVNFCVGIATAGEQSMVSQGLQASLYQPYDAPLQDDAHEITEQQDKKPSSDDEVEILGEKNTLPVGANNSSDEEKTYVPLTSVPASEASSISHFLSQQLSETQAIAATSPEDTSALLGGNPVVMQPDYTNQDMYSSPALLPDLVQTNGYTSMALITEVKMEHSSFETGDHGEAATINISSDDSDEGKKDEKQDDDDDDDDIQIDKEITVNPRRPTIKQEHLSGNSSGTSSSSSTSRSRSSSVSRNSAHEVITINSDSDTGGKAVEKQVKEEPESPLRSVAATSMQYDDENLSCGETQEELVLKLSTSEETSSSSSSSSSSDSSQGDREAAAGPNSLPGFRFLRSGAEKSNPSLTYCGNEEIDGSNSNRAPGRIIQSLKNSLMNRAREIIETDGMKDDRNMQILVDTITIIQDQDSASCGYSEPAHGSGKDTQEVVNENESCANSMQYEPPAMEDAAKGMVPSPESQRNSQTCSVHSNTPQLHDVPDAMPQLQDVASTGQGICIQVVPSEDVASTVVSSPGPKTRQRSRPSSVQSEPPQVNDVMEVFLPSPGPTTRQRRRPSSVQSEPPQVNDVLPSPQLKKCPKHRPRSMQSEPPKMADVSLPGRRSLPKRQGRFSQSEPPQPEETVEVMTESSLLMMGRRSQVSSVPSHPSGMDDVQQEGVSQKTEKKDNKSRVNENSPQSAPRTRFRTRANSVQSEPDVQRKPITKNLRRGSKTCSTGRSTRNRLFPVSETETNQDTDPDSHSTQSEPPLMGDVSSPVLSGKRTRKGKFGKLKSRMAIVPPDLSSVREEPEFEGLQSEGAALADATCIERDGSRRMLRNRRISESGVSQASSETSPVLRGRLRERHGSSTSLSSKSTIILDHSNKRKRSSSPSSPDMAVKRKFTGDKESVSSAEENTEQHPKGMTMSDESIEQYTTARRVTRYQKSLMERSMNMNQAFQHEFRERQYLGEEAAEESDGESIASSYTTNSSYRRSSARLRQKQILHPDRSPSQASQVSSQLSRTPPRKPGSQRSRVKSSSERSVCSQQSPSRYSPVRQSPDLLHSEKSSRTKNKATRKAQTFLASPSDHKIKAVLSDSSEVGSGDEVEDHASRVQDGSPGKTGSVKSVASSRSSGRTRSSLPSLRNAASGSSAISKSTRKTKGSVTLPEFNLEPIFEESSVASKEEPSQSLATPPNSLRTAPALNVFTPFTADELKEAERRRSSKIHQPKKKISAFKKRQTLELSVRKRQS